MSATSTPAPPRPRRSTGRVVLRVAIVVLGLLLVFAGLDRTVRDVAVASHEVDADGVTTLVMDTRSGQLDLTTSDRDDVAVVGEVTSGLFSREDVDVRVVGSQLRMTGGCSGLVLSACSVHYRVDVPADLAADLQVTTTAGEIQVAGYAGDVDVRTTAGAVRLSDFSGTTATVATTAGEIEVDAGATTRHLDLRTTAGSVDVRIDDREPLRVDIDTTVGSQSATVAQDPDADRTVVARTTAGEISVRPR